MCNSNKLTKVMWVCHVTDYCSTLEGEDSYSCWRAYFELKDLEVSLIINYIISYLLYWTEKEDIDYYIRSWFEFLRKGTS